MPLKDYIKRFEDGGEVEAEETTSTDTTTPVVQPQTKKKTSPLQEQVGLMANNPEYQAQQESKLRDYYNKQLADAQAQTQGFGAFTGIDSVLSKYALDPEGRYAGQGVANAIKGAREQEASAMSGLSNLDTMKAQATQRKTVSDLLRSGKPEDREKAKLIDPDFVKTVSNIDQAQSSYGKQASDMGFKMGTPEFANYVEKLRKEDYAIKKQQADLALAKLNLAINKDANKPLSGIEQKEVNALTDRFQSSSKNVDELKQLQGIVKDSGFLDTGVARYANPKYYFGAGKAAEIEAKLSALAPKQRPPGAGATSDYDAKQYLKAVGGGMSKENLQKTIQAGIAMNRHDADYAMFMATVKENRGSTTEAAKIWQQYANNNPIFDKNGNAITNRKTIQEWVDAGMPKSSVPVIPENSSTTKQNTTTSAVPVGAEKVINGVTYVNDGKGWRPK